MHGTLRAAAWYTVVCLFIAFERPHSARPCNGRSPFPHSCTSRWPQEPPVACVSNGSECQAVARTSEAHLSTYPTTPNSRNNMPYTTYSRSPLPTAYHHRRAWTCALGGRPVAAVGQGHLEKWPDLAPSRGPCWWARWATFGRDLGGSMGTVLRFLAPSRGGGGAGGNARVWPDMVTHYKSRLKSARTRF